MDNSSSGMPVRPPLSNGPSFRRSPHSRGSLLLPAGAAAAAAAAGGGGGSGGGLEGGGGAGLGAGPPSPVNVVTVIVNKDENGYGMKVSGDNPVYVQSVKGGGAAEKAGLHSGDKIIKVNGVNVTQSTHTDVVALIKSATQVVLTVQQRPRPASAMALASPGGGAGGGGGSGAASAAVAAASAAAHGLGAGVGGVLGGLGGLAGGALGGALCGGGGGGAPAGVGGGSGGSLASHHHHHHHTPHGRPLLHHHSAPARTTERITSPQPVDVSTFSQAAGVDGDYLSGSKCGFCSL
ncbi:hypothetical protein R5R35_008757 [Gryllus longicercus]|uniref:PDZ domain-containing protein n=1 Tax=Gryllus longicercus TaxID=2509291 RepID=A0AAN9Z8I6_9ORTH